MFRKISLSIENEVRAVTAIGDKFPIDVLSKINM